MTERGPLLAEVSRRLGSRRLVWMGLRGDDIEPLADLPQLHGVFSIVGSYSRRVSVTSLAYEDITGTRVDPEVWDIDDHLQDRATIEFRRALLSELSAESAILPYRPLNFLSAIHFARLERCEHLGLFGAHQYAFEHKPWVESAIRKLGLPRIPWKYVADEEQFQVRELTAHGEWVLRRSRTSGGEGFTRVTSGQNLAAHWPHVDEAFVSVAPYLEGAVPVNVGATVWRDGVTVHHPSIQLIGIESCVTRDFGYCGNDFGAVRSLGRDIVGDIERSTVQIGDWLRHHGYLGSFGTDYLLHDGRLLFTEINPRFQGSTHSSCRLDVEADESCLLLEHLAAWLGVPCPRPVPLTSRLADASELTNLVVHWTGQEPAHLEGRSLVERVRAVEPSVRADVVTSPKLLSDRGSTVARLALRRRVTSSGFDLDRALDDAIRGWQATASDGVIRG